MGGQALGSRNLPQYDAGQSGQAERVLNQVSPAQYNGSPEKVLIQAKTPGATFATDPAMRQAASQVAAALAALPGYAGDIRTPLQPGGQALLSTDGHSALVTFQIPGNVTDGSKAVTALQHAVAGVQASHADLRVAETGDASIGVAINGALNFSKAEATSVPVTLILLLLVFGALVAAGIPVLLALTSLTAAIGVLTAVSHLLPVNSSTFEVVVIIGMAVGVDYALFYLRREREERALGRSFPEALRIASRTSGRAIVVSGLTVMTTMAGLFMVGGGPFSGMALGTIAVVGISVAARSPCCPRCSPGSARRRTPDGFRSSAAGGRRPAVRFWGGLARRVVARPLIWGGIATVAMLALAAPALGLRVGQPAIDAPKNVAAVTTMDAVQRAFPQAPAPAEIVVTGQRPHRPAGHRRGRRAPCPRRGGRPGPPAGHRHRARRRARPARRRAARGQRHRHGVEQRAADAAEPGPARHLRKGARRQLRGGRRHGRTVRRHPPGEAQACPRCSRSSACSRSSCCSWRSGR